MTAPKNPAKTRGRELVRATGGPRYAVAIAIDALGTGLLRPFLLLFAIKVLALSAPAAGAAMTGGIVLGLAAMPGVGRWLDRGPRSTVVAASMLIRVVGTALLLATPAGNAWMFAAACLFLGIGNQAWPAAHAALVATIAQGRERDAALAAARALRNGGMGVGALIAAGALAGGTSGLRVVAATTGLAYLAAATLAWSVHISAPPAATAPAAAADPDEPAPRMGTLLAANVIYVFCLNVPEIALPLVLVTQLHASLAWAAGIFVMNTVLVVTLQVAVTVWMARFSRRTALVIAGVIISASYLGFLAATPLGGGWGAPMIAAVSVVCALGEIVYAGSATPLITAVAPPRAVGRALARFQLSSGFGLAVSPAAITALAAAGPVALWGTLAAATLVSAAAVAR
ncbi:MFS transporter [Catenulispora sp. NF23]|uniref:MFS transporter n=1 Tax=Catenulispora pinistramenti TaxID=2705254 RepID=A0ABS5KNV1_9ACTN|nr:MFS transporter [Catenulispora pinistramenti]MBS2537751.1 MFS transporter [Catenulispora pinistramenti]MBS2547686.1 MFS transporter [Catenulispora pinistramenti]